ncbi:hypothetical protein PM082_023219 [Marasmius tenuissimus]|nr:hypothetical protein PM082_023219 [Marasmius tenuissimus]
MASEQEIAKQALEAYTSIDKVIIQPITTFSVMFLVYGMYIIIFGLSLNVLWHRHKSSASKAYMRWIIALFVLITISNATAMWIHTDETLIAFNAIKTNDYIPYFMVWKGKGPSKWVVLRGLQAFSGSIASFIFDYLMVHCCYIIWGYSKRILYPFAFVILGTNAIGFVIYAVSVNAYDCEDITLYKRVNNITYPLFVITAVYTSLLTLLTAGRIWWTIHQVDQITGSRVYTKYKIFVATILESGFLYSAMQVVCVVLLLTLDPDGNGVAPFNPQVIAMQLPVCTQLLIGLIGSLNIPETSGYCSNSYSHTNCLWTSGGKCPANSFNTALCRRGK